MYVQLKRNKNGYTLPEVLMIIVIVSLMTGSLFIGISKGRGERALQMSANQLIQDLRVIQNRALAPLSPARKNELCGQNQPPEEELQKVIFGAYFETNSEEYILFVDCNEDKTYTPDRDKTVNPIGLEKGVKILELSTGGVLSIVFVSPDPRVYINGELASDNTEIKISLTNNPTKTKTIKIHKSGLIEIVN